MAWQKRNDNRRLTGRPWRRLRERILKRDSYLCQCPDCEGGIKRVREANEVDHIVPISLGGTNDDKNLRAVNDECHERLTRQMFGGERPTIGIDGCPEGWVSGR